MTFVQENYANSKNKKKKNEAGVQALGYFC